VKTHGRELHRVIDVQALYERFNLLKSKNYKRKQHCNYNSQYLLALNYIVLQNTIAINTQQYNISNMHMYKLHYKTNNKNRNKKLTVLLVK